MGKGEGSPMEQIFFRETTIFDFQPKVKSFD